MIQWSDQIDIYLHRETVDFRKVINGLSLIVEDVMGLSPFKRAIFVFCNRNRSQLKVLYWDDTGFVLWQKRLEKSRFKWPRKQDKTTIELTHEQWLWLLRGLDIAQIKPHESLLYQAIN